MGGNVLKEKSFLFAKRVVYCTKYLQEKKEYVLSKQLLRSGTAIGALAREAEMAESKRDFIHKMHIALKEGLCLLNSVWVKKYLNHSFPFFNP